MCADRRPGSDATVVADVRRPFDLLEVGDLDAFAEPDVAADADARDVEADVFFEGVEIRLPELVEIPDVLPVAVHDVPVDRAPHLEEIREELFGEVVGAVAGHMLQHLRLHHVDARVDRVGEHLAPRRLLEEAFHPPFLVRDDDAELERIVDRFEPDRHRCAPFVVEGDERAQVHVAEGIARDDEERLVELLRSQADRARRAERRLFDRVADLHSQRLPFAEVTANRLRQEGNRDDHLVHTVLAQQLEDVLHARLADDRHHRLGLVGRERAEAVPLAAGHDHGFHRCLSLQAAAAYTTPAQTASTRPVQKIQYGHSVDRCVTIRQPIPR